MALHNDNGRTCVYWDLRYSIATTKNGGHNSNNQDHNNNINNSNNSNNKNDVGCTLLRMQSMS